MTRPTEGWIRGIPLTPRTRAWVFPDQRTLVTETSASVPTPTDVHGLIDLLRWLEGKMPTEGVVLVHDWRALREVPRAVRTQFVLRRREVAARPERIVLALDVSPLARMAVRAAALSAQIVAGTAPIDLVDDPSPALRSRGATSPDPTLHARLRQEWARTGGERP